MKPADQMEEYPGPAELSSGIANDRDKPLATREELESMLEKQRRELAHAQGLLDAILDSAGDGIIALDLSGKVVSCNRKFYSLWNMPDEATKGFSDQNLLVRNAAQLKDPEKFLARVAETRLTPQCESFDVFELKDGRTLERRMLPQMVEGRCVGMIIVWHEITERRRAEQELRDAQALYHSLVDQMPSGVFRKDAAGRYVFANAAFARITGMPVEQIVGRTAEELLGLMKQSHGESCPAEEKFGQEGMSHHATIMQTGQEIEVEDKYTDPDGRATYYHCFKSPVFGFGGELVGTQCVMLDITSRKRAEAELDAERDLLRALLLSSEDRIYFKDLRSRFIQCGQKMAEFFGCQSPDQVVGKTDFDFFDPQHAKPAFEDEQEIVRTGLPIHGKVEKEVSKDGKVTWVLTSKMPLRNKAGEIVGTFGISKDITAMKDAEGRLEQVHRQLMDASRQAGMAEVATGVLHNVGNVLTSVNVAANVLAERWRKSKIPSVGRVAAMMNEHSADIGKFMCEDPKGRMLPTFLGQLAEQLLGEQAAALEELGGMEKNIDHIKDIVAMQQSYAKVSGITQPVKVIDLVEDALRMNDHALIRHDVKLVREFEIPETVITVDRHKVIQVLINLVRNAKYACDDSGRTDKVVTVRVTQQEERVRISIIDNGIGVAPENLTRIFNHGFTTRKQGHGFGLHSGALAAREMGGALLVSSPGVGQGAAFTLELPFQPPPSN